jgi:hypothetical protein
MTVSADPEPSRDRRSKRELDTRLGEHLDWLRASVERFDDRHISEAKRIAVVVRSLVHDTSASRSLLTQLDMRDRMVWRSAVPFDGSTFDCPPWEEVPGFAHIAGWPQYECSFEQWWRGRLFEHEGEHVNRSWLVLHVANFDGGAHIDPVLPAAYRSLTREGGLRRTRINSAGRSYPDNSDPVPSAIRTICTEVATSIESAW